MDFLPFWGGSGKLGLGHATRLKFCLWRLLCPATGGYRTGALPGRGSCLPTKLFPVAWAYR